MVFSLLTLRYRVFSTSVRDNKYLTKVHVLVDIERIRKLSVAYVERQRAPLTLHALALYGVFFIVLPSMAASSVRYGRIDLFRMQFAEPVSIIITPMNIWSPFPLNAALTIGNFVSCMSLCFAVKFSIFLLRLRRASHYSLTGCFSLNSCFLILRIR